MTTRLHLRLLAALTGAAVTTVLVAAAPAAGVRTPTTSLEPAIEVDGGSEAQRQRLALALERFADARLPLPDLQVTFAHGTTECNGHAGWFDPAPTPWRITICSELGFVHEHELAHAWDAAVLTDAQRRRFVALRGLTRWSSDGPRRADDGREQLAFVVQQVLSGVRPEPLTREWCDRIEAFEAVAVDGPRVGVGCSAPAARRD